jgi:MFS family permease
MRYTLLSFLCAATVIAYLQRSALGVPSKQIEARLGLDPGDMGLVWLTWYAGYAAFQIPSGRIADRLGSRNALVAFAVTWSALTAATGTATDFTGLCGLWGLMGVAQAGIFVCATKAISATYARHEQARASGALACCMAGGAGLSQYLTGRLLEPNACFGPLSWSAILAVYAVPGLVWAVAFAAVVPSPDAPPPAPAPPDQGDDGARLPATGLRPAPQPLPSPWGRLFTDRNMILLCAQQLQRAGAVALFFTWFPRYLQETRHVDLAHSGSLAAWPLVAGMLGGLLGGAASDWLLRRTGNARLSRQGVAGANTAACAAVSVLAYRAETAESAVLLLSVAAFCGYASGVNAYALALAMGGKRVAVVFATMNMAGNIGAGLFPFAIGKLVTKTGNWDLTLLLFAGMFAGATVCWALLNPTSALFENPHDDADRDPPVAVPDRVRAR